MPDRAQAQSVADSFQAAPDKLFHALVAVLLDDGKEGE